MSALQRASCCERTTDLRQRLSRSTSAENLRKILSGFYTASEINTAKKLMVCTFAADLAECPLKAERRKSMTRGVNEVEVDDIVGIFDYLDQRSNLSKATFAVANLEREYGPEEINICSIADKQSELGISVASLAARVDQIATDHSPTQSSSFTEFKTDLTNTVHQQFDNLQSKITQICSQLANGISSQHGALTSHTSSSSSTSPAGAGNIDRSRNIVLYGIDDTRDRKAWRDTVTDAIHTAAGREVAIDDAIRIGTPASGRRRPVLVRLQSVWDRRTVLGGSWRLSSTAGFERIYIAPDEPLEARRRRTLDRLVKKATAQGKHVSVANGVFSVDDITVFSLESGFIQHHDG